MPISDQDADFWSQYYSRGATWFKELPPELLTTFVETVLGVELPPIADRAAAQFIKGLPLLAPIVTAQTTHYIYNPDECTASSWTYHTLKYIDPVDTSYFDDALKGVEGAEQALAEIHCSADQLKNVKPCFSLREQIRSAYPYSTEVLIPKVCNYVKQKVKSRME